MKSIKVIKVGGKVINNEDRLDAFLKALRQLEGPKVLVHGGGSVASTMGERLGIKPNMKDGRRITDDDTQEVITMVYGGLVNKNIVAKLQALGSDAVGLSGADVNLISAKKRNPEPVDYGWVGDIEQVRTDWLLEFLRNDVIPVLAPLTHDGKGNILNTNADSIASFTASALAEFSSVELMLCFEQAGVMKDEIMLPGLNPDLYEELKSEKVITDGMIPKIDLGFAALKQGVKHVTIRSFDALQEEKAGTELRLT
ncbi:acetylglutamate kinase [Gracilimonas mengyeensis]|uniref:Acetylglutamate kinase n=1 Tax=Gracilimonas mengyeensis TaxID=1302730 RepID=A0A521CDF5_9BACT|nr:acetylglutamate kinase [Gracilimonas mengyeensis]SMO57442.1 N-acetylglutamate kinase [Gracilimonas mengyeensis]